MPPSRRRRQDVLKTARIGFSMGIAGTEVAKKASDIENADNGNPALNLLHPRRTLPFFLFHQFRLRSFGVGVFFLFLRQSL